MRVGSWALVLLLAWGSAPPHRATGQTPPDGTVALTAPASPPAAPSGYTVTGRVVCADTQHPARFAAVSLIAANSDGGGGRGRGPTARTDLDGTFSVANVQAGDYYVTAALTGYVNEAQTVQNALSAGGDALNVLSGIPEIHVTSGGASAQLSLQRGAVIAGTVQWDDGSPAAGVQVTPVAAVASGAVGAAQAASLSGPGQFGRFFQGASTDDRGRFRIAGLAPGAYLIRAAVQAPVRVRGDERGFARTFNLFVYAPDKQRRSEAAVVTLVAGEEHGDVALTLALAGLHSISGTVSSPGAVVRSGTVSVTDSQDSTLNRSGSISADGSFVVAYVPPGTYSMQINASSQAPGGFGRGAPASGGDTGTRFQPLQQSLTVVDGDINGLSVNVAPAAASQ